MKKLTNLPKKLMKNTSKIITLLSITLLVSCAQQKKISTNTIYVNSFKDELGNYLISEDKVSIGEEWIVFNGELKDFDFKTGQISIIEIEKENDSTYNTINIVEQYQDKNLIINDIWVLQKMENHTIKKSEYNKLPTLQFSISNNKVYGNDGCNNISGQFLYDDQGHIKIDNLMGTKMMCENMENPDKFHSLLSKTNHYKVKHNILTLFDLQSYELMSFKKID